MALQLYNATVFYKNENRRTTYHNINNISKFIGFARNKLPDAAYINFYEKSALKGFSSPVQTVYLIPVYICTAFFKDQSKELKEYFVTDLFWFEKYAKAAGACGFNAYNKKDKKFTGTINF